MDNGFKFKSFVDIGNLAAEDDEFLLKAFVQKDELNHLLEINNTKSILLGRTGTGKSALIKYLETHEENVVRVEPETMSLRHLSNSTIISYFKELDINLDLFYKVLWKHVFIVELVKMHFKNSGRTNAILQWFKDKFQQDKRKKKAVDYLERWEHHFWESTEYRIKEIEKNLEEKFSKELGANINLYNQFKSSGRIFNDSSTKETVRTELIHKAQKVVNEVQIEEVRDIMKILETEMFTNTQKRYYIVIDDLDKNWVDDQIVYDLIKGLIDTINEFRRIKQTKIVIALRTNILRKIFYQNLTRGVQREKYNHLYLNLKWSYNDLEELVNKRLKELMRTAYTNESPVISDIFPKASNKKKNGGFEYIVKRSLMRPRDVIDFFNKCIKHAQGQTKISNEIIKKAEDEYSHERLMALNDEWQENYGNVYVLYSFLKGYGNASFKAREVKSIAEQYYLEKCASNEHKELSENLRNKFEQFGKDFKTDTLLNYNLMILYEIGLLG